MMDVKNVKTRRFDLLSWAFVVAAFLFMVVSIPATFAMTSVAHSQYMAFAMVAVLEVLAFGSKLGSRWVPSWSVTLDRITKVLLSITTVANFGAGVDYLWKNDLTGFWGAVRNYRVYGFNPGALAIVLVLSALVPVGIYIFLSLFCKRQAELEVLHTPEAAADRVLEPVILQLKTVGRLTKELRLLNETLLLPGPDAAVVGLSNVEVPKQLGYDAQALLEENGDLDVQVRRQNALIEQLQREMAQLRESQVYGVVSQTFRGDGVERTMYGLELVPEPAEAAGPWPAEILAEMSEDGTSTEPRTVEKPEPKQWTVESLVKAVNSTIPELRAVVEQYRLNTARKAWDALHRFADVPKDLDFPTFERLYLELMHPDGLLHPQPVMAAKVVEGDGEHCTSCGGEVNNSDKGVAKRSKTPLLCKKCRDAAKA